MHEYVEKTGKISEKTENNTGNLVYEVL